METQEILDIVFELNIENEKIFGEWGMAFTFESNGYYDFVLFNGILLWRSDEDSNRYIEEKDEYEDLGKYLRKEFKKLLKDMNKIKFKLPKKKKK